MVTTDYGLRTTVGRVYFFSETLGRVHNDWRENAKLRRRTAIQNVIAREACVQA